MSGWLNISSSLSESVQMEIDRKTGNRLPTVSGLKTQVWVCVHESISHKSAQTVFIIPLICNCSKLYRPFLLLLTLHFNPCFLHWEIHIKVDVHKWFGYAIVRISNLQFCINLLPPITLSHIISPWNCLFPEICGPRPHSSHHQTPLSVADPLLRSEHLRNLVSQ